MEAAMTDEEVTIHEVHRAAADSTTFGSTTASLGTRLIVLGPVAV
jgi:hypothetical protein